jgi:hypothetical protein
MAPFCGAASKKAISMASVDCARLIMCKAAAKGGVQSVKKSYLVEKYYALPRKIGRPTGSAGPKISPAAA